MEGGCIVGGWVLRVYVARGGGVLWGQGCRGCVWRGVLQQKPPAARLLKSEPQLTAAAAAARTQVVFTLTWSNVC